MTFRTQTGFFLKQLLKQISSSVVLLAVVTVIYIYLMQFVEHDLVWVPYLVVLFALIKAIYFTFFTFRQVNKSIKQCHSFRQLLWVFGLLVFLIIFSYAADFNCIAATNTASFNGLKASGSLGYLSVLFEFFYFSVVTFAAIGYGDIVPLTTPAKLLVIMEIGQSFVLVVFGLSNINNIHTSIKNQ
ncbi:ion channel [uncultured Algoriphagus sp.]|uniref:ion channel n=1 Tax=uncultured Algoriphagus sp. TaxID=417365 RepID=UPI0030EF381D|tara:strand:- start:15252 stop:15809 length:558 start_codon:yes stop_codon:yes gene_type:complete